MRFPTPLAILPLLSVLLLLPCVGCGGSAPGSTPGDTSPPEAAVQVTLTTLNLSSDLAEGDEVPFAVEGTWSSTNVKPSDVYLHIRDAAGRFDMPDCQSGSQGADFTFEFYTLPTIGAGNHAGAIEILACKDEAGDEPYKEAIATVNYVLDVAAVTDWETHQRDSAHRGHIPILLDPTRFAKAWEWQREPDPNPEPIGGINAVVTGSGKVYVTKDVYFGEGILHALNESDGTEAWRQSFGEVPALSPPAVKNGIAYAAVTGHEDTFLWAFNADTGAFLHKSAFEGQWPHILAPTAHGDQVYVGAGYYGGKTYAFWTADGSRAWVNDAGGAWDMFTPAVDDLTVYHHNGSALFLIDRTTGLTSATIDDPFGSTLHYAYHGAPMIGGRNNVIAYAGLAFSGKASSNVEQFDQRVLSSFHIGTEIHEWSTAHAYLTVPAVADGVIYAARNGPMALDAMDEVTGEVLWSWMPAGGEDTSYHRNIVVTRNILFVSTDKAVYALDLKTRTPVWSYPEPGMLAISADRTLLIATGARESDGRLVAIALR